VVSGEAVHEHRGDTRRRSWGVEWTGAHCEGLAITRESTVNRKSTEAGTAGHQGRTSSRGGRVRVGGACCVVGLTGEHQRVAVNGEHSL
jgi:hypothetical protein